MFAAIRADLHNIWLHAGMTSKHPPFQPGDFLSHGTQSARPSMKEVVENGGRVATQSVEDQRAIFVSMLEAAKLPKQKVYFEHPDGREVTVQEMEAWKNGG